MVRCSPMQFAKGLVVITSCHDFIHVLKSHRAAYRVGDRGLIIFISLLYLLSVYHVLMMHWRDLRGWWDTVSQSTNQPINQSFHQTINTRSPANAGRPRDAVSTYRSQHFCFPWRRPCNNHAICCTDGKTIQCLPNSSQHVPIYLQ